MSCTSQINSPIVHDDILICYWFVTHCMRFLSPSGWYGFATCFGKLVLYYVYYLSDQTWSAPPRSSQQTNYFEMKSFLAGVFSLIQYWCWRVVGSSGRMDPLGFIWRGSPIASLNHAPKPNFHCVPMTPMSRDCLLRSDAYATQSKSKSLSLKQPL